MEAFALAVVKYKFEPSAKLPVFFVASRVSKYELISLPKLIKLNLESPLSYNSVSPFAKVSVPALTTSDKS